MTTGRLKLTSEAADLLRLKSQTLRAMRSRGDGPPFVRIAPNRVAYRDEDLSKWIESRTHRSNADSGKSLERGAA